ncbi:MAG: hypothetical protein ACH346_02305, partial [Chthoniobacterales bacterium]
NEAIASGKLDMADLSTQAAKAAVIASNHYTQKAQAYSSGMKLPLSTGIKLPRLPRKQVIAWVDTMEQYF